MDDKLQDILERQAIEAARMARRHGRKLDEQVNLSKVDANLHDVQWAVQRQLKRVVDAQIEAQQKERAEMERKHLNELTKYQDDLTPDAKWVEDAPKPKEKLLPEEYAKVMADQKQLTVRTPEQRQKDLDAYEKQRQERIRIIMENAEKNDNLTQKKLALRAQAIKAWRDNDQSIDEGISM